MNDAATNQICAMKAPPHVPTRHFRIGVVPISLTTSIRPLMDEYASLYRAYTTAEADPAAIQLEVSRSSLSLKRRRRYRVSANGQLRFEPSRLEEVLPYVEWTLNWHVPNLLPDCLQFHASAVEIDGQGVILPGESGVGKSTLTAGLLAGGARYLCDEFALLDTRTGLLQPYPRALCIKKAAHPVIRDMGLRLHGRRRHVKSTKGTVGFLDPLSVSPDAIGRPAPVRFIIFPRYTPGADPALLPISRAEAAFSLLPACFNLLRCTRPGVDMVASLVRSAACYRLVAGDLPRTCAQVLAMLRDRTARSARTA
ncbi:MAG: hypothetical protein JXB13_20490 [Phycisphaerae bacterium]|nr:hypothetical protein [Phycisphaerae bacterium]